MKTFRLTYINTNFYDWILWYKLGFKNDYRAYKSRAQNIQVPWKSACQWYILLNGYLTNWPSFANIIFSSTPHFLLIGFLIISRSFLMKIDFFSHRAKERERASIVTPTRIRSWETRVLFLMHSWISVNEFLQGDFSRTSIFSFSFLKSKKNKRENMET